MMEKLFVFIVGIYAGALVLSGGFELTITHNESMPGIPDIKKYDTSGFFTIGSISREDAEKQHDVFCEKLRRSTARFTEERACNDLCGSLDVERKLCFYHDFNSDPVVGELVYDKEEASCQQSGGKMEFCVPSACFDDGSCTSDCRTACSFETLTPVKS